MDHMMPDAWQDIATGKVFYADRVKGTILNPMVGAHGDIAICDAWWPVDYVEVRLVVLCS